MRTLKIAVAQFEPKDGDKDYNLSVIEKLTAKAKGDGAEVISFHELSITAYTFFKDLSYQEVRQIAEKIPDGKSAQRLIQIAKKYEIAILAGLVEFENDKIFNTYICVDQSGFITKYHKI